MSITSSSGRWRLLLVPALLLPLLALTVWLAWPDAPLPVPRAASAPDLKDRATIERGRYLAVLGNCMGCHTQRGQTPFAGGRGIATPWGTVYSSNLTPDVTGLKGWSADDFWRALHHGQSRDGRWLYPVFPYTNTTHISRADSDALYVYFKSLQPAPSALPPHDLRWPYNTQAALKVWRALYFKPGTEAPAADASLSDELRRGAYLVNGLAHCSACHMPRNALGGGKNMLDLSGGLMPVQNWYAPSLLDPAEAGVQDRSLAEIVTLLRSGRSGPHIVTGPMAEVVQYSTQHWEARDLQAMAAYLKSLPVQRKRMAATPSAVVADLSLTPGAKLYEQHCVQCHGAQGQGIQGDNGAWAYPPLAGNPTVLQNPPANLLQSVLYGGFGPSTAEHPRPYGMPPYTLQLSEREIAQLLSYVRGAWGNNAPPVTDFELQRLRGPVGRP